MRFLSSIRIVRVGLALAVALWMAGAGCLLGCEKMVAAAAADEAGSTATSSTATNSLTIVASGDACASVQSHDCCASHRIRNAGKSTPRSSQPAAASQAAAPTSGVELAAPSSMMMDCPLAVNATAALSKANPETARTALPHTHASAPAPFFQEQASALSPPPLLPNRGHTYLRCCVFLI